MAESAFQALVNLATLSLDAAKGLPAQQDSAERYSGVGFSMLGTRFVIPMGQVKETMEVPELTRLPGVKSWVLGLSNVRGRLLPIIDFARFLGAQLVGSKRLQRVLVLETESLYSGLIVDQCFGMQHLPIDTFSEFNESLPGRLGEFVTGAYLDDSGAKWVVFDLNLVAGNSEFANAAR